MKRIAHLLAGIALLSACRGEQIPTETAGQLEPGAVAQMSTRSPVSNAAVARDLATLRKVTAQFHQFKTATAADWSAKITDCMTSPDGGMGYHYGNTALIDGSVQVDSPELLLYEPDKNGNLSLVAVEYIIPYTAHSRDAAPPVLFGQEFQQNDMFQLWGLHAWVWKDNPSGMFANWNPNVTCQYATATSAMAS